MASSQSRSAASRDSRSGCPGGCWSRLVSHPYRSAAKTWYTRTTTPLLCIRWLRSILKSCESVTRDGRSLATTLSNVTALGLSRTDVVSLRAAPSDLLSPCLGQLARRRVRGDIRPPHRWLPLDPGEELKPGGGSV